MEIAIQCPFHARIEEMTLPDGYSDFEGEIKCPSTPPGDKLVLRIKLEAGKVVNVQRTR